MGEAFLVQGVFNTPKEYLTGTFSGSHNNYLSSPGVIYDAKLTCDSALYEHDKSLVELTITGSKPANMSVMMYIGTNSTISGLLLLDSNGYGGYVDLVLNFTGKTVNLISAEVTQEYTSNGSTYLSLIKLSATCY